MGSNFPINCSSSSIIYLKMREWFDFACTEYSGPGKGTCSRPLGHLLLNEDNLLYLGANPSKTLVSIISDGHCVYIADPVSLLSEVNSKHWQIRSNGEGAMKAKLEPIVNYDISSLALCLWPRHLWRSSTRFHATKLGGYRLDKWYHPCRLGTMNDIRTNIGSTEMSSKTAVHLSWIQCAYVDRTCTSLLWK